MAYFERLHYEPAFNATRLNWDLKQRAGERFARQYDRARHCLFPPGLFDRPEPVWLEIGAGSGGFFADMAGFYPDKFLVAVERCKLRGQRLVQKVAKTGLPNLVGYRGNAIPAVIHHVPDSRLERVYLMYPCPWPKNAQRKNRWYLHPMMPHLVRVLAPGGLLVWTSDQQFYIDEARYICERQYGLEVLAHGPVAPNAYNDLDKFPAGGRTKFERDFLGQGLPCFELIVRKASV